MKYTPIDYSSLVPEAFVHQPDSDFRGYNPVDMGWGKMNVGTLTIPDIKVSSFDAKLEQNVHLWRRTDAENTTVDTCIFLDGVMESDFHGFDGRLTMRGGMQNFMYQPESAADHYIPTGSLRVVHFTVDRMYYTSLLSEHERWSAQLKERILSKQGFCGLRSNTNMSSQMLCIVNDILNCPLTGNLRALVVEAKVIEFLALQLDQLVKEENIISLSDKIRSSDRDALVALREYLHRHFTGDHSLRSLALEFGLNEFKLKKGFKALFGTTVFDYVHDLKMDYARHLLVSGGTYISEVAGMVGYKNPNHFSTAFKRKFGINPTQMKK